ncbi:Catechol 2,3-dioxygenase [Chryseobacterium sp. RU37D]|uniref:VOC family protein n=1 Tax=Chryseobacterium sp. RU37D TaxID=1907397 RepID=UPI0009562AEE|nr:VOC family protein [Chryseobacterium sp. RU37D]SIQ09602.1 Catechol 2,3-dioxygenase [Chryseobacterium sp. RU37D]
MKRITGIGGIFFKCKDPKALKEWYKTHLGINVNEYGATFDWKDMAETNAKGSLTWSPSPETTKYFEPSTREFMINYTVDNLEALVEELKKENVEILDEIAVYDFGKFIHVLDPEGNKIELWEPM